MTAIQRRHPDTERQRRITLAQRLQQTPAPGDPDTPVFNAAVQAHAARIASLHMNTDADQIRQWQVNP